MTLITFIAFGLMTLGGVDGHAGHGDMGMAPWPAVPLVAEVTLNEGQITLAVLGIVVTLIGYHFTFSRYIRREAGVRDVQKVDVSQPLTVRAEVEFVPVPKFEAFEKYVHEREHQLRDDLQAVSSRMEERREEGAEQIDSLRKQLDTKFGEAIKANNISATKLHERIETMSVAVRGEIDAKVGDVRKEVGEMPGKIVSLLRETGAIGGRRS